MRIMESINSRGLSLYRCSILSTELRAISEQSKTDENQALHEGYYCVINRGANVMYSSNPAEQVKPTIQNRNALNLDSSQAVRTAFLSQMVQRLLLRRWDVLF